MSCEPKIQPSIAENNINFEVNINLYLNDDCLSHILQFLSNRDKLKIESVCKRWRNIVKRLWKETDFEIKQIVFEKMEYYDGLYLTHNQKLKFMQSLLKRCGPHISNLWIEADFISNSPLTFEEIAQHCKSVTNLDISNFDIRNNFCKDEGLGSLLKSNTKLTSIALRDLNLNGSFLVNLRADSITQLIILNCQFQLEHYFYDSLSKLKNVKILIIYLSLNSLDANKIISALNKSKCESIQKLQLNSRKLVNGTEFSKLILKQNNLSTFHLSEPSFDLSNYFSSLPQNSIQELDVDIDEGRSSFLKTLVRLTVLKCRVKNFTDIIIENIVSCVSIKKLNLMILNYDLSEFGVTNFSRFSIIESFSILPNPFCGNHNKSIDLDSVLENLAVCKTLKELDFGNTKSKFSESTFKAISLFENLNVLRLHNSNGQVKKLFTLISELLNLEKLVINGPEKLSNNFFKKLNDLKNKRKDKNILEIYIDGSFASARSINQEDLKQLTCLSVEIFNVVEGIAFKKIIQSKPA